jgi:hypothetical protein
MCDIRNKQFHYFSRTYVKKIPGEDGYLSSSVIISKLLFIPCTGKMPISEPEGQEIRRRRKEDKEGRRRRGEEERNDERKSN